MSLCVQNLQNSGIFVKKKKIGGSTEKKHIFAKKSTKGTFQKITGKKSHECGKKAQKSTCAFQKHFVRPLLLFFFFEKKTKTYQRLTIRGCFE